MFIHIVLRVYVIGWFNLEFERAINDVIIWLGY